MRLVEAVIGELGEQVEDEVGLRLADAALHGAGDEALALLVHLGADLLAHGAAQQVGFAERIAGKLLGDLHHLFLVDDDALRLLHQMIDLRMDRGDLLLAVLARIVGRDVLHRARPVERDQRDDVLDAVGPHADQRLAHARAFNLEHADHLAARQHRVGSLRRRAECGRGRSRCRAGGSAAPRVRARSASSGRGSRTSPARPASTYFMLNWVTGMSERGSRYIGTSSDSGRSPMTMPAACVEAWR